jgi:hypothetical protein
LSSKGQKDFICREEKGKAAWGHAVRPRNWWFHGSGWKLGFIVFFNCLRAKVSGTNRCFLGRRSVSLANYHFLGTHEPPAVRPSVGLKEEESVRFTICKE